MIKNLLEFILSIFFGILFRLDKRAKHSPNIEKVMKLYEKGGFSELFAKIRVWDAPVETIAKLVASKGVIVDLGCGDGLTANSLALFGQKRKVMGIELNPTRVKEADKGLKNAEFRQGDILKDNFPKADTILLIHVLHHLLSYKQQAELLLRCKNKLKRDGKLIVVEIKKRPVPKFLLTWLVDVFIFPILFEGRLFNFHVFYRSEREWKNFLEDAGFVVETKEACEGKPFSHFILSCKKKYNTHEI